jgi:hypothetical protein
MGYDKKEQRQMQKNASHKKIEWLIENLQYHIELGFFREQICDGQVDEVLRGIDDIKTKLFQIIHLRNDRR